MAYGEAGLVSDQRLRTLARDDRYSPATLRERQRHGTLLYGEEGLLLAAYAGCEAARELTCWPPPSSGACCEVPSGHTWRRHESYPGAGLQIACHLPKDHDGGHSAAVHRLVMGAGCHWPQGHMGRWATGIPWRAPIVMIGERNIGPAIFCLTACVAAARFALEPWADQDDRAYVGSHIGEIDAVLLVIEEWLREPVKARMREISPFSRMPLPDFVGHIVQSFTYGNFGEDNGTGVQHRRTYWRRSIEASAEIIRPDGEFVVREAASVALIERALR